MRWRPRRRPTARTTRWATSPATTTRPASSRWPAEPSPWEDHKQAGWHRKWGWATRRLPEAGAAAGAHHDPARRSLHLSGRRVRPARSERSGQPPHDAFPDGYDEAEQAQRELTRELIALRRGSMPLLYGDLITLHTEGNCWVFVREYMGEYVVAAFNNGASACGASCTIPAGFPSPDRWSPVSGRNSDSMPRPAR